MASQISNLPIEFLKIHHLQIIKDTPLEHIYKNNPFHVFEYEEYIEFVTDFIERLSPEIILQRLFAEAPDNILIAPKWGRSKHEILRDIEKNLESRNTYQGKNAY